jgi:hypothetical protein
VVVNAVLPAMPKPYCVAVLDEVLPLRAKEPAPLLFSVVALLNHMPRLEVDEPLKVALLLFKFKTLLPVQYNPVALLDVPETVAAPPERFRVDALN